MALPAAGPRPGLEKHFVQKPGHSQDPWNGGMSNLLYFPALPMFSWAPVLWSPSLALNSICKETEEQDRSHPRSRTGHIQGAGHGIPSQPPAPHQQSTELHVQGSGGTRNDRALPQGWQLPSDSSHPCREPGLAPLPSAIALISSPFHPQLSSLSGLPRFKHSLPLASKL